MWWVLVVLVVLAVLGVFEWRARNKPLSRGMPAGGGHLEGYNPRPMTGGHNADGRRD